MWREPADISRVNYAVDLMVVLRCTQQLLLRLKQFDDAATVWSTTQLALERVKGCRRVTKEEE